VIVREVAFTWSRLSRLSRQTSVWLLIILLGHVALMASPLHVAAMGMNSEQEESPDGIIYSGTSAPTWLGSGDANGSTSCMIKWTWPPPKPTIGTSTGLLPPSSIGLHLSGPAPVCPFPRAHGPPKPVDFQTALQVFRA
jgi:hypothetical protein